MPPAAGRSLLLHLFRLFGTIARRFPAFFTIYLPFCAKLGRKAAAMAGRVAGKELFYDLFQPVSLSFLLRQEPEKRAFSPRRRPGCGHSASGPHIYRPAGKPGNRFERQSLY